MTQKKTDGFYPQGTHHLKRETDMYTTWQANLQES